MDGLMVEPILGPPNGGFLQLVSEISAALKPNTHYLPMIV
jgi:hypothetical protein